MLIPEEDEVLLKKELEQLKFKFFKVI